MKGRDKNWNRNIGSITVDIDLTLEWCILLLQEDFNF